ncbi:MAG: peptidylprolyl isomerase [Candidatus Sumerlaeota bacterium]|nr:peptidylprolyl isomerase [Candidatus Sumerlaeota bacterium]
MKKLFAFWAIPLLSGAMMMIASCQKQNSVPASPASTIKLEAGVYAKMDTTLGNMIIQLYADEAPKTVENFISLAEGTKAWKDPNTGNEQTGKPLYNGTAFHRVIQGFMAQGGDPSGTGGGDVGFTIPMEKSPKLNHDRAGRVAMARKADPDSASCQFYITFGPTSFLDQPPGYAVFGQVIHGMEAVKAMEEVAAPRQARDSHPSKEIKIQKVTILRVDKGKTSTVDLSAKS